MDPNNESIATPVAPPAPDSPATPAEPNQAPTPPVEPAQQPAEPQTPAEGQQPGQEPSPAPAEPAEPQEPTAPRESAVQKRARELREKSQGYNALADRLDPQTQVTAPQPTPPSAAPQAPAVPLQDPNALPEYYDPATGEIDVVKLQASVRAEAEKIADERIQASKGVDQVIAERRNYATSVETDASDIAKEYDFMNPNSANYDADYDNGIEALYTAAVTDANGNLVRTDLKLKDFAGPLLAAERKRRTQMAAAQPNSVAGQAIDGAVAPTGSKPATPNLRDLPLNERARRLGYASPKK